MRNIFLYAAISVVFCTPAGAKNEFSQAPIVQGVPQESENVEHLAQQWNLSEKEYLRYIEIIRGPLGSWNPNIDPILALGIYASNQAEKRKYAELYAKQEYELTLRTQQFQREYRSAFNRLFPGSKIIESEYLQPYYQHQLQKDSYSNNSVNTSDFQTDDRILYFANFDCQTCNKDMQKFYEILEKYPDIYLDIYVLDVAKEEEVREWAVTKNIDIKWVKKSKITLNIENGLLSKLSQESSKKSYLYLSRGASIFKIEPHQIGL